MKKKAKQVPFMFGSNRYVLDLERNCQQNVSTHNELNARRVVDEKRTPKDATEDAVRLTSLEKRPDAKGAAMIWQRCVDERGVRAWCSSVVFERGVRALV